MHLLRIAGLLFVPALLHAGYVNIQLSATCVATTVTALSGSAACYGPDTGQAQAQLSFGNLGFYALAAAYGTLDPALRFHSEVSLQAAYQITFSGPTGPGYMEASVCLGEDSGGNGSLTLITPAGQVEWYGSRSFGCYQLYDVPIVFGVPLDVQISILATAGAGCCGVGGIGSASVELDYQALDAAKNPLSSTAEVVIPEPSTWQLWMVGFALLCAPVARAFGMRCQRRPLATPAFVADRK